MRKEQVTPTPQFPQRAEIVRAVQAHLGCNTQLAAAVLNNAAADVATGTECAAIAAVRVGLTPADLRIWSQGFAQ